MNVTLKEISDFLNLNPQYKNQVEVQTRFGYKKIENAGITAFDSTIGLFTESGKRIKTSPDHLMLSRNLEWVKSKELNVGDFLYSKDGVEIISKIRYNKTKQNLYDLQVAEVKEFYANDLVSHNSSFYEALFFGLYGKSFRKVNKEGLINTTNGKNTLVEVELIADGKPVKIVRGIKPNTFEIYLNGVLKNQDASVWDYQGWLESTVLRMDERTFRQLVILGSTSFVPFMSLKTWERRAVIEDILSLGVYSQMLNVVKKKSTETNQTREDTSRAIENKRVQLAAFNRSLKDIESVISASAAGYTEKIEQNLNSIQILEESKEKLGQKFENEHVNKTNSEIDKLEGLINRSDKILHTLESALRKVDNDIAFFDDHDHCPTCHQEIQESFKVGIVEKAKNEKLAKVLAVGSLTEHRKEFNSQLIELRKFMADYSETQYKIKTCNTQIKSLTSENAHLQKKVDEIANMNQSKLDEIKEAVEECNAKIESFLNSMNTIIEQLNDMSELDGLLRDSGVKAKIIAEHIPIINLLVKKYLEILDFPVQMTFNEDFSEIIRSRFNEEFSYGNLSNGERMRIDLALLFTWREITRLSNSASCNLLILDEIGDSSLDADGFDAFMKILTSDKENQSVVVISHKPYGISNQVDQIIEISKSDGFSRISKVTTSVPEEMMV